MRETAISVNKHIYSLLKEDESLKELVGEKIYPIVAEETVTYPFVIFTKESVNGNYTKDLLLFDTAIISVAIAANNYFETVKIAERVRAILENHIDSYFYNILLDNVTEEYLEDAFIQQLQFSAKIRINDNN